jgi:maltose alpha-D-glucosyltransferase/alpha-amylase
MLCEATWQESFWSRLLALIAEGGRFHGGHGAVEGIQTAAFRRLSTACEQISAPSVLGGEQSNTSAMFGERFILKLFRRLTPGTNPEFEIGRRLTERHELPIIAQVAGALEYRAEAKRHLSIAILHEYVPNIGDAWHYTLDELERYFERVQSIEVGDASEDTPLTDGILRQLTETRRDSIWKLATMEPPQLAQDVIGGYLFWAELLGRRVGELHVALANAGEDAAFSPEPFTRLYQRSLYQSMRSQARATLDLLRSQQHRHTKEAQALARQVLDRETLLYARFSELTRELIHAQKIRCHGDLHLGQVLFSGKDFVFIDFEGEPELPVSERRIKVCPLRDAAGMLGSFHYAAHAAIRGHLQAVWMHHARVPIDTWANFWATCVSAAFLRTYLAEAKSGYFLPQDQNQLQTLLRAFLLQRTLFELRYELEKQSDWINVPLEGITQYCNG